MIDVQKDIRGGFATVLALEGIPLEDFKSQFRRYGLCILLLHGNHFIRKKGAEMKPDDPKDVVPALAVQVLCASCSETESSSFMPIFYSIPGKSKELFSVRAVFFSTEPW